MARDNGKENQEKALTCIHPSYTIPCTPEPESKERDELIVKYFLNNLAEVSFSIASRINAEKENRK